MKRVAKGWAKGWADCLLNYVQADEDYRAKEKISKASQERIRGLLELAISVDQYLGMVFSGLKIDKKHIRAVIETIDDLNKRFAEYPSVVCIDFDPKFKREPRFLEKVGSVFHTVNESLVARYIFHLAEEQLLQNIRECICGKLFYAIREDQKSCSAICRHKRYEQTDDFKAKRREKLRENYKLHKLGKVKEKNNG